MVTPPLPPLPAHVRLRGDPLSQRLESGSSRRGRRHAVVKGICGALLHADVNIKIVQKLRTNIKSILNVEELAAGTNKRRLVQQARLLSLASQAGAGRV